MKRNAQSPEMSIFFRITAWFSVAGIAAATVTIGEDPSASAMIEHFAAYLVSDFLMILAYPLLSVWTIGGALAGYAGTLEILQRYGQFEQFAASCSGIGFAVLVAIMTRQKVSD
jgi:hypothetical protein